MYIIDNLSAKDHYFEIDNLALHSDEIIIASPFCFIDFSHFIERMVKNHIKSVKLITTMKKDEIISKIDSIISFQNSLLNHNLKSDVYINNRLHGKIYIFKNNGLGSRAIITSANITNNGLQRNHEWGCCFDDINMINKLEHDVMSTIEYRLNNIMIDEIKQKVENFKKKTPVIKQHKPITININDIVVPNAFQVSMDTNTRIFIKPIGSNEDKIYDGDYSGESEQWFSKRRPKAVRKNDLLVSYAVGARKIISIFKVLNDYPLPDTGNERWPWHFKVENLTPKFGKVWFKKNLHIIELAKEYVEQYDSDITNVGGRTLGALQWGADKIQLDQDFGVHLISKVMSIEQTL